MENPSLQPLPGHGGEEVLNGIQPGAGRRREMEGPSWMALKPNDDLGMFAGVVIVEDRMDHLAGAHVALDDVEELDGFLMAMALPTASDHRAVEGIEGGKQGGRAVAFVVMGERAVFARRFATGQGDQPLDFIV